MTAQSVRMPSAFEDEFLRDGYCVIDLEDTQALEEARAGLRDVLRVQLDDPSLELEEYHDCGADPSRHESVVSELTSALRSKRFPRRLVESNIQFFKRLLGPDICIQRDPYLRVARPDRPDDNVGYHRDTHYGRSPLELSVWIPFCDVPADMALRILPGSHLAAEAEYPTQTFHREDVNPGSIRHRLGVPYAPKLMSPDIEPMRSTASSSSYPCCIAASTWSPPWRRCESSAPDWSHTAES